MTREFVDRFYTAFAATDDDAMAACYGDGIVTSPPLPKKVQTTALAGLREYQAESC
jgi:hypothetical protein